MRDRLKELLEELEQVMEQKHKLNVRLSEVKKREIEIEDEILKILESTGLDEVRVDDKRISRNENIYFNITDWDAFLKWCKKHKIFPIQKRPQTTFLREYFEQNNKLPDGIDTYVKESLSIRKV